MARTTREHRLRTGPTWAIGRFRSAPPDPPWSTDNHIGEHPLIVFPDLAVEIAQSGHRSVVANPNVAVLYDAATPYRRRPIDPRGDRCTWLAVGPAALASIVAQRDPRRTGARLFRFPRGPVAPEVRLAFQRLLDRLPVADDLEIEERLLTIADRVVAAAVAQAGDPIPRTPTERRHRDAVHAMERVVSARFLEPLSLDEVAAAAELSPYHGARLFRRHTGRSIHEYREQLRLRVALGALHDQATLDTLALSLGFTHHSHFTARFHRTFGLPPGAIRAGS